MITIQLKNYSMVVTMGIFLMWFHIASPIRLQPPTTTGRKCLHINISSEKHLHHHVEHRGPHKCRQFGFFFLFLVFAERAGRAFWIPLHLSAFHANRSEKRRKKMPEGKSSFCSLRYAPSGVGFVISPTNQTASQPKRYGRVITVRHFSNIARH